MYFLSILKVFSLFLGIICNPHVVECNWHFPAFDVAYYVDGDYLIEDIPTNGVQIHFSPGVYELSGHETYERILDPSKLAKPARRGLPESCSFSVKKKFSKGYGLIVSSNNEQCWMRFTNVRSSWDLKIRKIK